MGYTLMLYILTFVLGLIIGWAIGTFTATTDCPDCNEGEVKK